MAEDHRGRGLPQRNDPAETSPYQSRPAMSSGAVTLPSMQDPHGLGGGAGGRHWDSRSSGYGPSPSSANGYPPPQQPSYSPSSSASAYPPPGPGSQQYLPPVQPHPQDARGSFPPQDPRSAPYYAGQQRPPAMGPGPGPGPAPYGGYDYSYRPDRHPGAYPDYARGGAQMLQQSAPRQRTSIACRYCRRRKIRCSGYQNSPGGKCTNCIKMNQECIFQPVSSSSSTAFVPVSALQNGVIPPGTQLFGAYGQPLAVPSGISTGGPPPGYQGDNRSYEQPLPSPTGSYGSFTDDRSDSSRRRPRPPDEDHGMRLPPPSNFPPDDNRRRSPSSSSPGYLQPYQAAPAQHGPPPAYDNRTPPPRGSPTGGQPAGPPASVMSLGSIMDSGPGRDIDTNMLGRLNRRN
ncbi:RNA polymerase II-specific transcription factor-like protein [Microdochium nivale]|nr:RNA polymerase II-specific transcription factor-like protein [Microdochium nivale]